MPVEHGDEWGKPRNRHEVRFHSKPWTFSQSCALIESPSVRAALPPPRTGSLRGVRVITATGSFTSKPSHS